MSQRFHIKICEGHDLKKMDAVGKSDPYVTLRLKSQEKRQAVKTEVMSRTIDPIWNQEFDIIASDPNDTLIINMYDEDIKNDDKMMDTLEFPVSTWQIGAPVDRKEIDLTFRKKPAGKLIIEVSAFQA